MLELNPELMKQRNTTAFKALSENITFYGNDTVTEEVILSNPTLDSLGIDSLDLVEIVMFTEENLNIHVPDEVMDKVNLNDARVLDLLTIVNMVIPDRG